MRHRNMIGAGPSFVPPRIPFETASRVFQMMDTRTRQSIYDNLGIKLPSDRTRQAIEYLRDPIHMAQFGVQV